MASAWAGSQGFAYAHAGLSGTLCYALTDGVGSVHLGGYMHWQHFQCVGSPLLLIIGQQGLELGSHIKQCCLT